MDRRRGRIAMKKRVLGWDLWSICTHLDRNGRNTQRAEGGMKEGRKGEVQLPLQKSLSLSFNSSKNDSKFKTQEQEGNSSYVGKLRLCCVCVSKSI